MTKEPKPPKKNPWNRRDWPKRGDRSMEKLYAAVGRTLSQWEKYEGVLSLLFSYFVVSEASIIARRAYNAVRTFEGRAEMLQAASTAYFSLYPNVTLQEDFREVLLSAKRYSPIRNDIAHGSVGHFQPEKIPKSWRPRASYALYPSYANFKDRDLADMPTYCYTSKELDYFFREFYLLQSPANHVAGLLVHLAHTRALRRKSLARYRATTNPAASQKDGK